MRYLFEYLITAILIAPPILIFTYVIVVPFMLVTGAGWYEARRVAVVVTKELLTY